MGFGTGDARDLLHVQDASRERRHRAIPAASRTPRAHESTEWPCSTRWRSCFPSAARPLASSAASSRSRSASSSGLSRRKRCSGSRKRVEDRVRGEHREAARCSFVDDLVGCACAHVVHERVMAREEGWNLRAWHCILERGSSFEAELGDEPLEFLAMRALIVGQRGTVDVEHDVAADGGNRAKNDLEPLCPRVAAECEQTKRVVLLRRRARELGEVDAVPDRLHLVRLEWERAAVDRNDRGREALGGAQQPTRAPVGEPEQERHTQRPHERRREHGIDRAHVRDDCSSTQSAAARGRAQLRNELRGRACGSRETSSRGSSWAGRHRPRRLQARRPGRRAPRAPRSSAPSLRGRGARDRPAA